MNGAEHVHRNIVVIGASAGGVATLRDILRGLPPTLPAAVFIVCHTAASGSDGLAGVLGKAATLPVAFATDREPIQAGTIRVAPADYHIVLDAEQARLTRGPKHNRARPSIDVLFRSAADVHGNRVVGVVLTGLLDDGSAGLLAIKRRGGIAVVQDPADAQFPDMPRNALAATPVDHCVPVSAMGPLLSRIASDSMKSIEPREAPLLELEMRADGAGKVRMEELANPSGYSCPECGGVLWEVRDPELLRFRCRVGHAFSTEGLKAEHERFTEDALWAAIRALKESASFAHRLAERYRRQGLRDAADDSDRRAERDEAHSEHLVAMLVGERPGDGLEAS